MELPRFADTIELNNAWLVGIGLVGTLVAVWVVLVISSFLLRQGIRASRVHALEPLADGIYRRARLLAVILSVLGAIAASGLLGFSIWEGLDLQPPLARLFGDLDGITPLAVGRGIGLILALFVGFYILQGASRRAIGAIEHRVAKRELPPEQRVHVDKLFVHLPPTFNLAVAFTVVRAAVAGFRLPDTLAWFFTTITYALLLVSAGRALVFFGHFLSERLLWSWEKKSKGTEYEEYYVALRRLLPIGQRGVEAIIYVLVATLIVREFETLEPFAPYGPIIIRVISMFLAASVVAEFGRVMIARLFLGKASASVSDDAQRRRSTFISLIQRLIKYAIYFCIGLMVLNDLGIDPTPILAGAGIVGLTLGLGAQKIVQDMLNGLFLLFEDQILNGDYVRIGETEGVVEELTLRITRIRDRYGRLHLLRNGEIQNVVNYSRGWTLAVVDMTVAYEADLQKALDVIQKVSARLTEVMPGKVVETPKVMGIEAMEDSYLRVRIETKVAPACHFDVKRTLNRLLVDGFREHNLEIPYPKSVQYAIESPDPPLDPAAPPAAS